jgi:hypothetical protein
MKYLKLFEDKSEYHNEELTENVFREIVKTSIVPFDSVKLKSLIDYVSQWKCTEIHYSNQKSNELTEYFYKKTLVFMGGQYPLLRVDTPNKHFVTILPSNDDYYYIFDWISGTSGHKGIKYLKCDDIGGVKMFFDSILKGIPKMSSDTFLKKVILEKTIDTLKHIDSDSLSINELTELKKYIDSLKK